MQEVQKPEVHERRQVQGADFAAEFEAHAEVVHGRRILPMRDVQEQEDTRQRGREARGDEAGVPEDAVLALQRLEIERWLLDGAVEEQ